MISASPVDYDRHDSGTEGLRQALDFVRKQWRQLEHKAPRDSGTLIGLPEKYIVPATPSEHFSFQEQYYWDTYFTAIGYNGPNKEAMIEGMLDNLIYLFERFGIIPTANRMYFTGRSQPPLLTSYIFYLYDHYNKSTAWLAKRMAVAEREYHSVWMGAQQPNWRRVGVLNRYYDINALHDLAEAESGWDMTPRFERKCLDFYPVDLNALLYKYESDFARLAEISGDKTAHKDWQHAARMRKKSVDELMWNEAKQMYFDYNYVKRTQSSFLSLASFYPLWAGMASQEQAAGMAKSLPKFMHIGGLSATVRPLIDMSIFGSMKTQWAIPNGWAPLHYIVTEGLEQYGFSYQAAEIAKKWIATNLHWYESHGEFIEKYNVVNPERSPHDGMYPSQAGFAWTNAIFVFYARKYYGLE